MNSNDIFTAKQIYDNEAVIGTYQSSKEKLKIHEDSHNNALGKFYCSSCKRYIHCQWRDGQLVDTCTNKNCQCKCKTHWLCRFGHLHRNTDTCECKPEIEKKYDDKNEAEFQELIEDARNKLENEKSKVKYRDNKS